MIIRREQMDALHQVTLVAFENEMVVHSKEFSPRLCELIGEEQLRVAIREAVDRAHGYGFTNRGPVRLFIELSFLFGSAFDTDPQYPWSASILRASDDQMQRAERLRDKTLDYQDKVSGPDNTNTRKALEELFSAARQLPALPASQDFALVMLKEMVRIFPQKTAYVGEESLQTLISEGRAEARRHRFPPVRGEGLLVGLMFAFGHGCASDPLYPWISRTLEDARTVDPSGRAERLQAKALTWLSHVLARPLERAQA